MRKIYLDNAATTAVDERVFEKMIPYFCGTFGNASSQHNFGRDAELAVMDAREKTAAAIGAKAMEIYFTSGGTESDNWAIQGIALARADKGKHIITSAIEHPAVLDSCRALKDQGFEITYLPVDSEGIVRPDTLKKAMRPDTILVSVMAANNEIGTIQSIKELCAIAKAGGAIFHTDAVQAIGAMNINVKEWGIDLLSLSAHKIYGPKGAGALYVRSGLKIAKFMRGGEQERNIRAGTYNVPAIVGLGEAIMLAVSEMEERTKHEREVRDYFVERVLKEIPEVSYNGSPTNRLASNASLSFKYVEGEGILLSLDLEGIAVSSGSACSSGSLAPSHVLLAIGKSEENAHGTIRFSFGKDNTKSDADITVDALVKIIKKLRAMSPLYSEKE